MAFSFLGATLRRRLSAVVGVGTIAIVLAWLAGFGWFLHLVGRPAQLPPHADGIVAFTGGPDRVETALRLLAQGRADRLLLSGIGGGAELSELARLADVDPLPLVAKVTIGRNAMTTRGNAIETAGWARADAIHSLLVVTAAYHMPRALAELSRSVPTVDLYPVPVAGSRHVPLRLLAEEYVKYLASVAGLTAVLPIREPALAHSGRVG